MGYTLTLQAPSKQKANEVVSILEYFSWLLLQKPTDSITVSTDPNDHGYAKVIKNGVYVSYSSSIDAVIVNFLFKSFQHLSIKWKTKVFHDDEDITSELQHSNMKWRMKIPENLPKFLFSDRVKKDNEFKNFFDTYIIDL